jgi:hypothetical protein
MFTPANRDPVSPAWAKRQRSTRFSAILHATFADGCIEFGDGRGSGIDEARGLIAPFRGRNYPGLARRFMLEKLKVLFALKTDGKIRRVRLCTNRRILLTIRVETENTSPGCGLCMKFLPD